MVNKLKDNLAQSEISKSYRGEINNQPVMVDSDLAILGTNDDGTGYVAGKLPPAEQKPQAQQTQPQQRPVQDPQAQQPPMVAPKPAEQVVAENDKINRKNTAAAIKPQELPNQTGQVPRAELTWKESSAILKGVRGSGQYTLNEVGNINRGLSRISRNEGTDEDYDALASVLRRTPWKTQAEDTFTSNSLYNGQKRIRVPRDRYSSGGRKASEAVANIYRKAEDKALSVLEGKTFGGSEELRAALFDATGIPGSSVVDYMIQNEIERAREMGINNPSAIPGQFPVITAMQQAYAMDQKKAAAQIEFNSKSAEAKTAAELDLHKYERKKAIDQKYEFGGIPPWARADYLYFASENSGDPKDENFQARYMLSLSSGERSIGIGEDGGIDVKEAVPEKDLSEAYKGAGKVSSHRTSPTASKRKYDDSVAGENLTKEQYAKGLNKQYADDNPDVTPEVAQKVFVPKVETAASEYVESSNIVQSRALSSLAAEAAKNLEDSIDGGTEATAHPVTEEVNGSMQIKSEESYLLDTLESIDASDDLIIEAMGGSKNKPVRDLKAKILKMHKDLSIKYASSIADLGIEAIQNAPEYFGPAEVFSDGNQDNGLTLQVNLATEFYKEGKEARPIINTDTMSKNDTALLHGLNSHDESLNEIYQEALLEAKLEGDTIIRLGGSANPRPMNVYDGQKLVDYLKTSGMKRMPTEAERLQTAPEFHKAMPFLRNSSYRAMANPDAVARELLVDQGKSESLMAKAREVAAKWATLKPGQRTIGELMDGGLIGDGLKSFPGPTDDLFLLFQADEKATKSFVERVINSKTPEGRAIQAGLKSTNGSTVYTAFMIIESEMDRMMRAPIDGVALSLAKFSGDAARLGEDFNTMSLSKDTDVVGYMSALARTTDEPMENTEDLAYVIDEMGSVLDGIVDEYSLLGGDSDDRRSYQGTYLGAIEPMYNIVASAIKTLEKRGMPVSEEYKDIEAKLSRAVDDLNEDPELNYVKKQIGIMKQEIEAGSSLIDGIPVDTSPERLQDVIDLLAKDYNLDVDSIPSAGEGGMSWGDKKLLYPYGIGFGKASDLTRNISLENAGSKRDR